MVSTAYGLLIGSGGGGKVKEPWKKLRRVLILCFSLIAESIRDRPGKEGEGSMIVIAERKL